MGHFTTQLLEPRVVAELIGLSPSTLRRWDAALLPDGARRRRRYSWAEVETLQRAVHQASGRGGTPSAFLGPAAGGGPVRRPRAGRASSSRKRRALRRSVVNAALPRSARRRDRKTSH